MGYTHYWRLANISQHSKRWSRAVSDMTAITRKSPVPLGGAAGLNKPAISSTEILFNGDAKTGHDFETFYFPGEIGFNFTKTNQKPYDVVVTACLAVAKDVLGDAIDVSSDGDASDWDAGVELAKQVLGREIQNPIPERKSA